MPRRNGLRNGACGAARALVLLVTLFGSAPAACGIDPRYNGAKYPTLAPSFPPRRSGPEFVDCSRVASAGLGRASDAADFAAPAAPRDVLLPLPRKIGLLVSNASHEGLGASGDAGDSTRFYLDPSFRFVLDVGAQTDVTRDAAQRYCAAIFAMDHGADSAFAGLTASSSAAFVGVLRVSLSDPSATLSPFADESYRLTVSDEEAHLVAPTPWGAVRGLETFSQLVQSGLSIPHAPLVVSDAPAHAWRGVTVDLAQRPLPRRALLRTLDVMSYAKLNVLHLRLSSGGRAALVPPTWAADSPCANDRDPPPRDGPRTPRLTLSRLRAAAAYARLRGITLVLEWDPADAGHELATRCPWARGQDRCAGSLALDDAAVVDAAARTVAELARAVPGPFFHVGGRAALASCQAPGGDVHRAYDALLNATQAAVAAAGATPVVWEDAFHHGAPLIGTTVVQAHRCWPSGDGGVVGDASAAAAAARGHPVVQSSCWGVGGRAEGGSDAMQRLLALQKRPDPERTVLRPGPRLPPGARTNRPSSLVLGGGAVLDSAAVDASTLDCALWPAAAAVADALWRGGHRGQTGTIVARAAAFVRRLQRRGVQPAAVEEGGVSERGTHGRCPSLRLDEVNTTATRLQQSPADAGMAVGPLRRVVLVQPPWALLQKEARPEKTEQQQQQQQQQQAPMPPGLAAILGHESAGEDRARRRVHAWWEGAARWLRSEQPDAALIVVPAHLLDNHGAGGDAEACAALAGFAHVASAPGGDEQGGGVYGRDDGTRSGLMVLSRLPLVPQRVMGAAQSVQHGYLRASVDGWSPYAPVPPPTAPPTAPPRPRPRSQAAQPRDAPDTADQPSTPLARRDLAPDIATAALLEQDPAVDATHPPPVDAAWHPPAAEEADVVRAAKAAARAASTPTDQGARPGPPRSIPTGGVDPQPARFGSWLMYPPEEATAASRRALQIAGVRFSARPEMAKGELASVLTDAAAPAAPARSPALRASTFGVKTGWDGGNAPSEVEGEEVLLEEGSAARQQRGAARPREPVASRTLVFAVMPPSLHRGPRGNASAGQPKSTASIRLAMELALGSVDVAPTGGTSSNGDSEGGSGSGKGKKGQAAPPEVHVFAGAELRAARLQVTTQPLPARFWAQGGEPRSRDNGRPDPTYAVDVRWQEEGPQWEQ